MCRKIVSRISHYLDVFYNKYYPPQVLYRNRQRRRLKNRSFSLLTGNCVGGYLYHQLGLGFTSPTINMMILNQDFKKLILNPEHYMNLVPTPYEDPKYPGVPSALLGDIVLHFTHYLTSEEGIAAWEKRKRRIDYDNLYVIISDIDLSRKDIEELRDVKCRKLVVMTSREYDMDYCLYLPEFKGREHVGELLGKTLSGKWKFEKYFDFVDWVNSDDSIARNFYIGEK